MELIDLSLSLSLPASSLSNFFFFKEHKICALLFETSESWRGEVVTVESGMEELSQHPRGQPEVRVDAALLKHKP